MTPEMVTYLRERLTKRQRTVRRIPGAVAAAVLVPLFYESGEPQVLFTQRSPLLPDHQGEVAFPGGRYEAGDGTLLATALRESQEEIGLRPHDVEVLGPIDDLATHSSNFVITPFVGVIPYPYPFRPDPVEVAEIFSVPLSFLQDADNRREETWEVNGAKIPIVLYRYRHHKIWGATQRITENLLEILDLPPDLGL